MSQCLLSDLKKFRYEKNSGSSKPNSEDVSSKGGGTSKQAAETTAGLCDGDLSSPVIGRRRISSCHSDPDKDMPVVKGRSVKRCRLLSDSDEDGEPADRAAQDRQTPPDDPTDPDTIETNLAFIREAFPDLDLMDAQDCLAQHGWRLEPTMAALADQAEAARLAAQQAQKERPQGKRRRLVVVDSDSSDEEGNKGQPATNGYHPHTDKRGAAVNGVSKPKPKPKPKPAAADSGDEDDADFEAKCVVYMSDSDDDDEDDEGGGGEGRRLESPRLQADRQLVVQYLGSATLEELACMSGCSRKKAELIVQQRPFTGWPDTLAKFQRMKSLSPHLLNSALRVLKMREMLDRLLRRCEEIALKLKARVSQLISGGGEQQDKITEQPANLNPQMRLSPYQMIGLSWLILMFKEKLNAVLADEMGLGKTIQALSFLAYLQQQGPSWQYLIVVPSSTLDNWLRELSVWCPSLTVLEYRGSIENRREARQQALRDPSGWQVMVTTYNIVASTPEDKAFVRSFNFKYVVFDEAHMLKNMASKRYGNLMRLKAEYRLLLTGTPLQNNLVELMSLLVFVMPHMFGKVRKSLQTMFEIIPKAGQESRSEYETARIEEAKRIMSPFFLRRLKRDVLKDLPPKTERVMRLAMTPSQAERYRQLKERYVREAAEKLQGAGTEAAQSGVGMMMTMRKLANHPVLLRYHYTDDKLREIAKIFAALPDHEHKDEALVLEDLTYLSDFEVHQTCRQYPRLRGFQLPDELILQSGKLAALDDLLPRLKAEGSRVLLFSQFVIMLDVLEAYLRLRGHRYCRLDGSTAVTDRIELIDKYNNDSDIFVFLLSTRAGGLGINLTSANVVILHDVDFNPHNDKQAEDRCHRIGQTREVQVIKLICTNSIDECMLQVGQQKLTLDRDISGVKGDESSTAEDARDVRHLLELALASSDG